MRCLLDKVTARHIMEGLLKLAELRNLTEAELFALDLYGRASTQGIQLFILPQTENVLQRLVDLPRYAVLIGLFRNRTSVAQPTRYFKRWARRLRDVGFTKEDAAVLALARKTKSSVSEANTFGTDANADVLGMHVVATFDQPMINQWMVKQTAIQRRLTNMQQNLPMPYRHALLPQVQHPESIIFA